MIENQTTKKTFLLLEVLIALSLLLLFAPVLMRLPIHQYKAQIRYYETLEKQRIADWTYSEIKESLLQGAIPWSALPEHEKEAKEFSLSPAPLYLPKLAAKTVQRSFTLRCKHEKIGRQGEIFRLYELVIRVDGPSNYRYLLLLQLID